MIPLRDNVPSTTRPIVNIAIIIITAVMFFMQLSSGQPDALLDPLTERYGMIPARMIAPGEPVVIQLVEQRGPFQLAHGQPLELNEPPFHPWWTLLTSIFLHGGLLHFVGNMWFLWIFGDNVEDRLGHLRYLLFYLGCGVFAGLTHLATNWGSVLPTIGASGAIAGVMGAYFLLYPRARVLTLLPLILVFYTLVIPAPLFLGLWFVLQFWQGVTAWGAGTAGGVAWWAHVGGFVAGMFVIGVLSRSHQLRPGPLHYEHRGFVHRGY